jgi:hypothetical protein
MFIAHYHKSAKAETAATFHNFGRPVDEDHFLDQLGWLSILA